VRGLGGKRSALHPGLPQLFCNEYFASKIVK
jgi:hypothetical protein